MADTSSWSAFGSPSTPASAAAREPAEPEYGPAPPAGPGRASFGFTAGPISGNRPISGPPHPSAARPEGPAARDAARPTSPGPGWNGPSSPGTTSSRMRRPAAEPASPGNTSTRMRRPAAEPASPGDTSTRMRRPAADAIAPTSPGQGWNGPSSPGTTSSRTRRSGAGPAAPTSPAHSAGRSITAESVLAKSRHSRKPPAEDDGVGDLIGGPGHEIRQHRAARHPGPTVEHAGGPADPPRRGRGVRLAGLALSAAVLLGGAVAGTAYFSDGDTSLTSVLQLGAGGSESRSVSAPIEGRTAASFELLTAVTRITVRSEDIGDDLYRMSTAEDAGLLPKAELQQDKVQLQLVPDDGDGSTGAVEVVLSSKVVWTLRFAGAVDEQILNLTGGQVGGIDLVGGSRLTDIALPKPAGTVALRIAGAVEDLKLTSPTGNPVRVQVQGGAKTVTAGTRTLRDVKPGSTLTPKGWATNDRYDVNAEARVTLLSVETAP